jgi:acetyl-CoA acetyltransferase
MVVTTLERARDLAKSPVVVHAATLGQTSRPGEEDMTDLRHSGLHVVSDRIWRISDLALGDMDLFYPYDGFSILPLCWFENIGYCGPGEAGPFIESNWNRETNRIEIDGRVPVNTHGGSLSEGGTQGAGQAYEAVLQLRGEAGVRQVPDAHRALITTGGFFFNAGAMVLRADDQ